MEPVRAWGAALCCAAVACAILQLLAPRNGSGRLLELTGAAVFLCCALSPLVDLPDLLAGGASSAVLSQTAQNELLQTRLKEQLEPSLQQAVQQAGEEALAAYGLSAEKIEAVMDTGEDGGIYITKITAALTPKQAVRQNAVKQVLKERFDVDVEVKMLE